MPQREAQAKTDASRAGATRTASPPARTPAPAVQHPDALAPGRDGEAPRPGRDLARTQRWFQQAQRRLGNAHVQRLAVRQAAPGTNGAPERALVGRPEVQRTREGAVRLGGDGPGTIVAPLPERPGGVRRAGPRGPVLSPERIQRKPRKTRGKKKPPKEQRALEARLARFVAHVPMLHEKGVIDKATLEDFQKRAAGETVTGQIAEHEEIASDPERKKTRAARRQRGRDLGAKELEIRTHINEKIAPLIEAKFNGLSAVAKSKVDEKRVGGEFDKVADRAYFLLGMAEWMPAKTVDAAISHFSKIREVNVKGLRIEMHDDAARRVELVARFMDQLGIPFPIASNAFSLRGRYKPWAQEKSIGKMMHPMGFAIDYRVYANPHIINAELKEFRDIFAGTPGRFQLRGGSSKAIVEIGDEMERLARAAAAGKPAQMDKKIAAKAERLLRQFDSEFARVTGASAALVKKAKDSGLQGRLQDLRKVLRTRKAARAKIEAINKEIKRLARYEGKEITEKTGKKTRKRIEALEKLKLDLGIATGAAAAAEAEHTLAKAALGKALEPWVKQVETEKGSLERRIPDFKTFPDVKSLIEAEQAIRDARKERPEAAAAVAEVVKNRKLQLSGAPISGRKAYNAQKSRVGSIIKTHAKLLGDQRKREQLGPLIGALEAEQAALQKLAGAAEGEKEGLQAALDAARGTRRTLASSATGLSKNERKYFAREKFSKGQLRSRIASATKKQKRIKVADAESQEQWQDILAKAERFRDLLDTEWKGLATVKSSYAKARRDPKAKAAVDQYYRIARLGKLRERLLKDEGFLIGSLEGKTGHTAGDPSIRQLTELGFFTADPVKGTTELDTEKWLEHFGLGSDSDAAAAGGATKNPYTDVADSIKDVVEGEKAKGSGGAAPEAASGGRAPSGEAASPAEEAGTAAKPKKAKAKAAKFAPKKKASRQEGFTLTFMRLMAMHGFTQGIEWGGSQDAMHFDLEDGRSRLVKP